MLQAELERVLDPETCRGCHEATTHEWEGSMHAYASIDPVFRAMNRKYQATRGDADPSFCIQCHAPLALRYEKSIDGLNLHDVADEYQGVTCVSCHNVDSITRLHNNGIVLRGDDTMLGALENPLANDFHSQDYSTLTDRSQSDSSMSCGSCHDIVNHKDLHLERTYAEWQESLYGTISTENTQGLLNCGSCHMRGRNEVVSAMPKSPIRRRHDHSMPGIDVALLEGFPRREEQREQIQRLLNTSLGAHLCVDARAGFNEISVTLENIAAGHDFPSGATFDRRIWLEIEAYRNNTLVFTKGQVASNQSFESQRENSAWHLHATLQEEEEEEDTHSFWSADSIRENSLEAPKSTAESVDGAHAQERLFVVPGGPLDRVEMRFKLRPIGLEILRELSEDYDLDERLIAEMPTFTLGSTELSWKSETDRRCIPTTP